MKDGSKSQNSVDANNVDQHLADKNQEIRSVTIRVNTGCSSYWFCLKMYDADKKQVFAAGIDTGDTLHTIDLQPGERLLGLKAAYSNKTYGALRDPVFLIGRME